jgi:hypothetical protein
MLALKLLPLYTYLVAVMSRSSWSQRDWAAFALPPVQGPGADPERTRRDHEALLVAASYPG